MCFEVGRGVMYEYERRWLCYIRYIGIIGNVYRKCYLLCCQQHTFVYNIYECVKIFSSQLLLKWRLIDMQKC